MNEYSFIPVQWLRSATHRLIQQSQRWTHPARDRLRRDPLARLNSLEEVPIAAALGIQIDANQATVDDWLRLPGLSIHQARTLTSLSQSGVPFYCLEDVAAALGVPVSRLAPLSPLLQFCYYDPVSLVAPAPIWLNQATRAQLLALPKMTTPLAEQILQSRQQSLFRDWGDFHRRLQLSPEKTTTWLPYIRI